MVTISDNNSTLKGLRFEFLTEEGNPQDLKIYKMDSSKLPKIHSGYPPASELFYISPEISASVKVEMPVKEFSQEISYTTHFIDLMKWIGHDIFDREGGFWRPELSADNYHNDVIMGEVLDFETTSNEYQGLYYLAVRTRQIPLTFLQNLHDFDVVSLGVDGAFGNKGTVGNHEVECNPKSVGDAGKSDNAEQRCGLVGQSYKVKVKKFRPLREYVYATEQSPFQYMAPTTGEGRFYFSGIEVDGFPDEVVGAIFGDKDHPFVAFFGGAPFISTFKTETSLLDSYAGCVHE